MTHKSRGREKRNSQYCALPGFYRLCCTTVTISYLPIKGLKITSKSSSPSPLCHGNTHHVSVTAHRCLHHPFLKLFTTFPDNIFQCNGILPRRENRSLWETRIFHIVRLTLTLSFLHYLFLFEEKKREKSSFTHSSRYPGILTAPLQTPSNVFILPSFFFFFNKFHLQNWTLSQHCLERLLNLICRIYFSSDICDAVTGLHSKN